jgi:membrane-associated phospholipid phosphatase
MSWPVWVALASMALFVVLTALVATGVTRPLDGWVVQSLRPNDRWGVQQIRWSPWMTRLEPQRMYAMLAVVAVVAAVWRRSGWPVLFAGVVAGASVGLTVAAKVALARPDPHGYVSPSGGSYPSGHMVAVVACSTACLLLVWPRIHWLLWAPVTAAVGLMAGALLASAAHWLTDVVGGVLLGVALVSGCSVLRLRQRAATGSSIRKRTSRGATTSAPCCASRGSGTSSARSGRRWWGWRVR